MNNPLLTLKKPLIGMLHVPALQGTPKSALSMNEIIEHVVTEAVALQKAGFHALMIENMHDIPYVKPPASPVVTAAMTAVALKVREQVSLPLGVQILCGANREALSVAIASSADFIRVEGFVYGHLGDEGYIDSCAGDLLRYRKAIGAEHIAVLTDIKKKHSAHAMTQDVSLAETAHAAEFFLSDGLIVTGVSTGEEAKISDLKEAKDGCALPVYIGSGITADNLKTYFLDASGFIIGSSIKKEGHWANPLCESRMANVVSARKELMASIE